MSDKKINIAIVGLSFGAEFIPIYQKHPNSNMYAICQRSEEKLNEVGDYFGVEKRYTSYEELLEDPEVDAVHINTPVASHAPQVCAALRVGKHVASTIPMATTVEECKQIVELVEETGLTYCMMETVVYSREFLYAKELYDTGELGKIQFIQGSHVQDMEGWPDYWEGFPPMHNATHCVSPMLGITGDEAEYVSCFGSGTIDEKYIAKYNSPFSIESTHIKFRNSDLSARVYRSLFGVARQYRESLDVYGSKKAIEWPLIEGEDHVMHTRGKPEPEVAERVKVPDYAHLLPKEIQEYTTKGVYDDDNNHLSFAQGAGHGGSHPHLVHEFVSAIVDKRDPYPNARQGANITCVGILAHQSALNGGGTCWRRTSSPPAS